MANLPSHFALAIVVVVLAACGKKEATPPTTAPTAAPAPTAPTTAPTAAAADASTPAATTAPTTVATAEPVDAQAAPEVAEPPRADDAGTGAEPDDDEPKGEPLPASSPLHPVCAAHAKASELEEGWQCRLERELEGGGGAVSKAAIVRFTHFDLGAIDQRLLAFEGAKGWGLGPVIVDTSVSGVGGVSARGQVVEASLGAAGEAPLVVVRVREIHGDSDMGVNAYTEATLDRLTVCSTVEDAVRCATLPTAITQELSKVDEGGDAPPADYGPVGKRTWARPVTIAADGALEVGATTGKIDPMPPDLAGKHSLADALGRKLPGVAVWPE